MYRIIGSHCMMLHFEKKTLSEIIHEICSFLLLLLVTLSYVTDEAQPLLRRAASGLHVFMSTIAFNMNS